MNASGINFLQKYALQSTDMTGIICLLLAVWFSMTSGIPYGASLAQVTLLYHSAAVRLIHVDLKNPK